MPDLPRVAVAAREDLACRPCLWDLRQASCEQPVCLEVPVNTVIDRLESLFALAESNVANREYPAAVQHEG